MKTFQRPGSCVVAGLLGHRKPRTASSMLEEKQLEAKGYRCKATPE